MAGFWKATGRDKAVYDKAKLIGMRKTLVFYKGRAPNGQKSDWIMHEYRLESDENGPPQASIIQYRYIHYIYVPFPFLTYSMLSSILHKQMFEIHYFLLVPFFLAVPLQSVHAIK